MTVFEDLIVELEQENLLERTVIDTRHLDITEVPNNGHDLYQTVAAASVLGGFASVVDKTERVEIDTYDAHLDMTVAPDATEPTPRPKKPGNAQEFYQKRAVAEVSNLQMVEHILTGVEREYMKIMPATYDDYNAKKALNSFLHVAGNENSPEHREAESNLMQETEAWCTALGKRDVNVPVSSVRQYCETTRPALSSQALVALARFYRNLPYSASVRSKFDFVITRLFSRPAEQEKRVCIFSSEETLGHINALYRDWSSIALYSAEPDESDILLTALSFEDLAIESENAGSFDHLIESNFFGRLRSFKESISERFYAPNVLAAAIDANVRIGNAYVTLIGRERQKMDAESIQLKYGDEHDDTVSDGAARTIELVDLLRSPLNRIVPLEPKPVEEQPEPKTPALTVVNPVKHAETDIAGVINNSPFVANFIQKARSVNRWFLAVSALLVAASFGLYIYSSFIVEEQKASPNVTVVEIDGTLSEHVKTARISGDMLYGVLLPSWDTLPKEKRQEYLLKVYQAGREKGYKQVTLLAKDGKPAAFASATHLDVVAP